jgi:hypothetical protein
MRNFNFFLCALILAVPVTALCQTGLSDPGALKICAQAKDVPFPAGDHPTPEEAKGLKGCVSEELYFGFEKKPDYVAARKCAYLEMDQGKNFPFAGKAILMMVYANGNGATRNLDLATRLACEVPGSPGDLAGRIHEIDRFKTFKAHVNFSICDHAAASYMYDQCAIMDYRFDHLDREKTLVSITANFTASQKKAYQALHQAAAAYFKVEAAKGIELKATHEIQEVEFLERGFVSNLQQLERGELPKFSAPEAAKLETAMKSAFDKALAYKRHDSSNVTPEGLKETQKEWLNYRKAWVQFGKARYPAVTDASWEGWLDDQRAELMARAMQ